LSALELLDKYWLASHHEAGDLNLLNRLAGEVIKEVEQKGDS